MLDQKKINGFLIVGDFNFGDISWHDDEVLPFGPSYKFKENLEDNFIFQNIEKKTFQTEDGKFSNILDLVLTESNSRIYEIGYNPPLGNINKSHLVLTWAYKLNSSVKEFRDLESKKAFRRGDYENITNDLLKLDWHTIFENKDIQNCYGSFLGIYNHVCDKFIPSKKEKKTKNTAPWINSEIKSLIREKYRLWHFNTRARWRDDILVNKFHEIKKKVKNMVKLAVKNYEFDLAKKSKKDPKIIFKYMNSKRTIKENITSLRDKNGYLKEDGNDIVTILGQQFKSVFEHDNGISPVIHKMNIEKPFDWDISNEITIETILTRLEKLNENKACGCDQVRAIVLKRAATGFAYPLMLLFIKSLNSGEVPLEWREANVSPIYKNGPRTDAANYRPVSLTSIVCKIIEGIIKDKLLQYLVVNRLIAKEQHGFIPGKACNTNLLETIDVITDSLNKGYQVDVIFLDFEKAFDKVSHRKLIQKLRAFEISEVVICWIESFLTNRRQRIIIGKYISEWEIVSSGVPQGSVLGPILFTIFINDLPREIESISKFFADDSKIIGIIKEETDCLKTQRDLNNAQEWSLKWQCFFNSKKCKVMHFGKKNKKFDYKMIDRKTGDLMVLEKTASERDLGILISNDLKWSNQIAKATKTANFILGQIKNSFVYLEPNIMKYLYVALVRPHLEFVIPVWNPYLRQDVEKLERIQRRATKMSPQLKKLDYSNRIKRLELTKLETRRKRGDLIQFYKILNSIDNVNWINNPRCLEIANSETDITKNLRRHKKHFYRESNWNCPAREHFFLNRVIPLWNELPFELKDAKSLNSFKAGLDRLKQLSD